MAHILILEDDNYMNEEIKFHVDDEGHTCDILNNADSLMEKINILANYKLLILDLMMIRGKHLEDDKSKLATGEIIFRKIQELFPKLEIVILTAMSEKDIHLYNDELNDIPVFYKPLDSEYLKSFLSIINERTGK